VRVAEKRTTGHGKTLAVRPRGAFFDLPQRERALEQASQVKMMDPGFLENRYLLGDFTAAAEKRTRRSLSICTSGQLRGKGRCLHQAGFLYDALKDHKESAANF